MDEKPKSIWKKSWTGRRALPIWGALAGVTILLVILFAALGKLDTPVGSTFQTAGIIGIGIVISGLFVIYFLFPVCRWLFWKHWRRTFFALACFATLIALFYAEEDWRGKHDWEKFKREWEAKGEHFDYASVIPPPVPDDQNFALTPIVASSYAAWLDKNGHRVEPYDTNVVNRLQMNIAHNDDWPKTNGIGNWQTAKISDLKVWQNYYRTLAATTNEFPTAAQPQTPAQDVLLALSKYDSTIEELQQASQLPYSRFPLNYDGMPAAILLPQLAAEKRCSQVLQLRAVAELQNNESQKALDDVKLMLRLTDASRTEPFLISHLVRIAILQITLQPIYEGLAEHKWSGAQFVQLDSELAKLNFLADYQFAIRGERALCIGNIEFIRHPDLRNLPWKHPRLYFLAPFLSLVQVLSNFSDSGEDSQINFQTWALSFGPSGWLYQNELRIARFETKWYLPVVDPEAQTISSAKIRAAGNAFDEELRHRTPENLLETLFMPALGGGARKFAYAQSSVNLARVAIALERYRLAHGEFPDSLDALAPQFIAQVPHDIIGGQPLKYRREADGQFTLYSVGWNETDDGGVVGLNKSGSVNNDKGDWVWRYPQK